MKPNMRERVEALPEKTWKILNAIGGAVIGALGSVFLYGGNGGLENQWSTIYALLLVLVAPRLIEQYCGRSVLFGKKVMLGTVIAGVVYVLLSWGIRTGFTFAQ